MTVETVDTSEAMNTAVDFYLEHSKVKPNGLREVPLAPFVERMETHGVTKAEYKKLQDAIDFETTAIARVALADVERKISEASEEDLKNEEFRTGLSAAVRIPTFGGATEVECYVEKHSNIPFRGDNDGNGEPAKKITYGRFRTQIHAKGRIYKSLHDEAADRVRSALGVAKD